MFFCLLAHQSNPRFGGGFPIGYETGVNLPKAVIEWSEGNPVVASMLVPRFFLGPPYRPRPTHPARWRVGGARRGDIVMKKFLMKQ